MKTALVTGISSGIGLATPLHLARNGYRVFAGMRNTAMGGDLTSAAQAESLPVEVVERDVCDRDSVAAAFATIRDAGSVEVLVNNAGIGGASPLELIPEDEHRQMSETNIFENSAPHTRYDRASPYQPLMRRNGKLFAAGFKRGVQPQAVADVILEAVKTEDYRLRWPVGPDAEGFMAARQVLPAEAWVAMGADLSDTEYNARFAEYFGIEL